MIAGFFDFGVEVSRYHKLSNELIGICTNHIAPNNFGLGFFDHVLGRPSEARVGFRLGYHLQLPVTSYQLPVESDELVNRQLLAHSLNATISRRS